jgi:hypothetical protein
VLLASVLTLIGALQVQAFPSVCRQLSVTVGQQQRQVGVFSELAAILLRQQLDQLWIIS